MLTISANPIFSVGSGGVTISGVCSQVGYTIEWWFIDTPDTVHTDGTSVSGTTWSIDVVLSSAVDQIVIRARLGSELSGQISVNLATNHEQPLPTQPRAYVNKNEFDSFGYANDLDRYTLESNVNYRARILDVYRYPGSATLIGLLNGIERELLIPRLDPFFFLSVRFNPATNAAYDQSVVLSFEPYRVSVQLRQWIVYNEPIDLDPITKEFTTQQLIGDENVATGNTLQIYNGTQLVPSHQIHKLDDHTVRIDLTGMDLTKEFNITYPYKKVFDYIGAGNVERTVDQIRSFLEGVATIPDITSGTGTRPLIVWNDGYLSPIASIPTGIAPTTLESRQQILDLARSINAQYYTVSENKTNKYYEYINNFKAKGYFSALNIIPRLSLVLTTTPVSMRASFVKINQLFDKSFQERLHTMTGGINFGNLKYYATELQKLTRMGINRAVVDGDEWNSDSHDKIGNNFIPSEYDGGKQMFGVVGSSNTLEYLTLNQRKSKIKLLANQV